MRRKTQTYAYNPYKFNGSFLINRLLLNSFYLDNRKNQMKSVFHELKFFVMFFSKASVVPPPISRSFASLQNLST